MEPGSYYDIGAGAIGDGIHGGYTKPGGELRVCFTSYEDSYYQGKVLYCVGEYWRGPLSMSYDRPHADYNLKKLGWNDKISSCVFKVIKVGEITNGSIKPHPEIK